MYKKGNKTSAENDRPVSLTSQCSKLMESIIRDALMEYIEVNQLLNTKWLHIRCRKRKGDAMFTAVPVRMR